MLSQTLYQRNNSQCVLIVKIIRVIDNSRDAQFLCPIHQSGYSNDKPVVPYIHKNDDSVPGFQ
jgi:hypothetical protein